MRAADGTLLASARIIGDHLRWAARWSSSRGAGYLPGAQSNLRPQRRFRAAPSSRQKLNHHYGHSCIITNHLFSPKGGQKQPCVHSRQDREADGIDGFHRRDVPPVDRALNRGEGDVQVLRRPSDLMKSVDLAERGKVMCV